MLSDHSARCRSTLKAGLTISLVAATIAFPSYGQVPTTFSFQGYLTDSAGVALNGSFDLDLSLHTDMVGGTQVWSESQSSVEVVDGLFSIRLGTVTPLDPDDFAVPLYLQVQVAGDPMAERTPLTSVPYAFNSARADTAAFALTTAILCHEGDYIHCYTGPPATLDVGECVGGYRMCEPSGIGFGSCSGETVPIVETCDGLDNDCDGEVDNPPPCCEDDPEPNDTPGTAYYLGDYSDCDSEMEVSGHIADASDEDWFSFYGYYASCTVDPSASIGLTRNMEICMYMDCYSGTNDVSCPHGATASSTGDFDGCCSTTGIVELTVDCHAGGDEGDLLIKVAPTAAISCRPYTVTYQY